MSKSFRGLCTLPLEFFYKTLRQPTLVFDTSEIYRKESFDLSISQCSFPVIPTSDHMILYIMFFLPQWRALNKRCTAVHSPALQSSVWPLLLSELWPSLSLPVGEGYKLLFYLLFRHYVKKRNYYNSTKSGHQSLILVYEKVCFHDIIFLQLERVSIHFH